MNCKQNLINIFEKYISAVNIIMDSKVNKVLLKNKTIKRRIAIDVYKIFYIISTLTGCETQKSQNNDIQTTNDISTEVTDNGDNTTNTNSSGKNTDSSTTLPIK